MQIEIQKKVNKNEAFFTNASFFCGIIKVFLIICKFNIFCYQKNVKKHRSSNVLHKNKQQTKD
ncbi:hypothetical protein COF61_08955 [Bacillus toyonensis]|nr:hypothetical protein COF61_08955 [Bacillus toyonensis]